MAKRPVFRIFDKPPYFIEEEIEFKYHSGFAEVQIKKSIASLHESYLHKHPNSKVLEVSTKSKDDLGKRLSAFNLMIRSKKNIKYSVESAFQSSKVFEKGGPYKELLKMTSKEAKQYPKLKESGKLKHFSYNGKKFELTPTTSFYDWLYINTMSLYPELINKAEKYEAFTDIVFNPKKSLNCQAKSLAILVSLSKLNKLDFDKLKEKKYFIETIYNETLVNNPKERQISFFNDTKYIDKDDMDMIIEKYKSSYIKILKSYYPAHNSTGFTEPNQPINFSKAYESCYTQAITWFEAPTKKPPKGHIDAVIINPNTKEVFLIEAKRFSNPDDAKSKIYKDIKRIVDYKNITYITEELKGVEQYKFYAVVLADVWLETDSKNDVYDKWKNCFLDELPNDIRNKLNLESCQWFKIDFENTIIECKAIESNYKLLIMICKITNPI